MKPKKIYKPKTIFQSQWLTIKSLQVIYPPDILMEWEYIDNSQDAVCGPLIDENNNLILVKEWRGAWQREVINVVTGGVKKGLSLSKLKEEFIRESREETGFLPQKVTFLGRFMGSQQSPSYRFIFLGQDLKYKPLAPDKNEYITTIHLSFRQALKVEMSLFSHLAVLLAQRRLGL